MWLLWQKWDLNSRQFVARFSATSHSKTIILPPCKELHIWFWIRISKVTNSKLDLESRYSPPCYLVSTLSWIVSGKSFSKFFILFSWFLDSDDAGAKTNLAMVRSRPTLLKVSPKRVRIYNGYSTNTNQINQLKKFNLARICVQFRLKATWATKSINLKCLFAVIWLSAGVVLRSARSEPPGIVCCWFGSRSNLARIWANRGLQATFTHGWTEFRARSKLWGNIRLVD